MNNHTILELTKVIQDIDTLVNTLTKDEFWSNNTELVEHAKNLTVHNEVLKKLLFEISEPTWVTMQRFED